MVKLLLKYHPCWDGVGGPAPAPFQRGIMDKPSRRPNTWWPWQYLRWLFPHRWSSIAGIMNDCKDFPGVLVEFIAGTTFPELVVHGRFSAVLLYMLLFFPVISITAGSNFPQIESIVSGFSFSSSNIRCVDGSYGAVSIMNRPGYIRIQSVFENKQAWILSGCLNFVFRSSVSRICWFGIRRYQL